VGEQNHENRVSNTKRWERLTSVHSLGDKIYGSNYGYFTHPTILT